jgi:hypothetical protein
MALALKFDSQPRAASVGAGNEFGILFGKPIGRARTDA